MIQRKYIKHTWNVINLISVFDFIVNIRTIFQIHKSKKTITNIRKYRFTSIHSSK